VSSEQAYKTLHSPIANRSSNRELFGIRDRAPIYLSNYFFTKLACFVTLVMSAKHTNRVKRTRHTRRLSMMNNANQNNVSVYKIESGSYMIKTGSQVTIIRFNVS
jgi:hypothetical protein